MKARLLMLASLLLTMVACQNDPSNINTSNDEVDFHLTISAEELNATRAGENGEDDLIAAKNSAHGAIDYLQATDWTTADLRYTLEVYDKDDSNAYGNDFAPIKDRQVIIVDAYTPVVFNLRIIPNRDYCFAIFADFVEEGSAALSEEEKRLLGDGLHHRIGATLKDITIINDGINEELTDAYFATKNIRVSNSESHDIVLKRPYGKLRVIATDLHEVNINLHPASVDVTYTAKHPTALNVLTGAINAEDVAATQTFDYDYVANLRDALFTEGHIYNDGFDAKDEYTYTNDNGTTRKSHVTLFTDYILGDEEQRAIHFTMDVKYQAGETIKATEFNTDIPIQRNYLTTVIGNVLTTATEIEVRIDDNFTDEIFRNEDGLPVDPDDDDDNTGDNTGGEEGSTTPTIPDSAQLPDAATIKSAVAAYQHVKFIAGSAYPSTVATRSGETFIADYIWVVYDTTSNSVEIHTAAKEFVANDDLNTIFKGNNKVKTIDFGDNFNTLAVTTLQEAFSECTSLTSINLESFDTSNVTTMTDMFNKCKALTNVDITALETNKLADMSRMFKGSVVEHIDLTQLNSSNVGNMSEMFRDCKAKTIRFGGKFDTSNVTDMSNMFKGCTSTFIDFHTLNTSSVTNMSRMFESCTFTELNFNHDYSEFDTSNVTDMSYMFYRCRAKSLNIKSFNTSKVTNMQSMFLSCTATYIDLSSFKTLNVTNMNRMFCGCHAQTLDLTSFNTSKVTDMEGMFRDCQSEKIDISSFDISNVKDVSGMFMNCKNLISIKFGKFNALSTTSLSSLFSLDNKLESIDLTGFNTSTIENFEQMFNSCSSLKSIDLSSFDTSKAINMNNMFTSCKL